MRDHDPAGCAVDPCARCADFNGGWTAGKAKAFSELHGWQPGDHAQDCGCSVCQAAASIVSALVAKVMRLEARETMAQRRTLWQRAIDGVKQLISMRPKEVN